MDLLGDSELRVTARLGPRSRAMPRRLVIQLALLLSLVVVPNVSADGTWVNVGSADFTADTVDHLAFAFNGSTPYLAFRDADAGYKATVMMFDGTDWVTVGAPGISSGSPDFLSLAFDGSAPYVAFEDAGNGHLLTVKRFDGEIWATVGTAGFSASAANYPSLAIHDGTPYVAYEDVANGLKATVKTFNGTDWVDAGPAGFSSGQADFTSLAIDDNGVLYVAYDDVTVSAVTVQKFDGTSWSTVGPAGFSGNFPEWVGLALDSHGAPYVVYADGNNDDKATTMTYDGSNWKEVGPAGGFSAGGASYTTIAVLGTTPYVAFQDVANGAKGTVMKFNGVDWEAIGGAGFTAGQADEPVLALDANGTPFIAFADNPNSGKATVMTFAEPATITVSTNADGGADSLRDALTNAAPDGTILIKDDVHIVLTQPLEIDQPVTIDASEGSLTLDGNDTVTPVLVNSIVTFNHLAVINGAGQLREGTTGGGGMYVAPGSTLNLSNATFQNNSAEVGSDVLFAFPSTSKLENITLEGNTSAGTCRLNYYQGSDGTTRGEIRGLRSTGATLGIKIGLSPGYVIAVCSSQLSNSGFAIVEDLDSRNLGLGYLGLVLPGFRGPAQLRPGPVPEMIVSDSTVANDSVTDHNGGGVQNTGIMTIANSTIVGNIVTNGNGGGIYNSGTLTVINSTISGNGADNGGGLYQDTTGSTTLINTIIANSVSGGDCRTSGTVTGNHTLIADAGNACGLANGVNGNLIGIDPQLGPLQSNGGGGQTMALLMSSPAIDAGDDAVCAAPPVDGKDQRGLARPVDGDGDGNAVCDIGASEAGSTGAGGGFFGYKTKPTKGAPGFAPVALRLADRFERDLPFVAAKPGDLLLPVARDGQVPADPVTHLQAYALKDGKACVDDDRSCTKATDCNPGVKCKKPAHAKHVGEAMRDAFGLQSVDVGKPQRLLVPSATDPNGVPPSPPDPATHGLDRFKCYKAKLAKGSAGPPAGGVASLGDDLTTPAKSFALGALAWLCAPVARNGEPVKDTVAHLLCYKAKPAKKQPKHVKRTGVGVHDELGTLVRDTTGEDVLCVPAVSAALTTPTP